MCLNFDQLSFDTLAKIKEFDIKSEVAIYVFNQACRMLKAYLEKNNLEFSFENGKKWLSEVYPCEPATNSQRVTYNARRRTVFMLWECHEGKLDTWRTYPQKTPARPETTEYLQLVYSYAQKLQTDGLSKSTIKHSMKVASFFLIYLESFGKFKIDDVTPCDVIGYFAQDSFFGRKPNGVKEYARKLKSFLVFLENAGEVTEKKLSLAVPKVFAKQESIVTILSEDAVKALKSVKVTSDARTVVRDHAMILLALRLGIRQSDIYKMKLTDINWKNDNISFIQQKTGVSITLPLLPDVGNALMEYILNFRPQVSNDTIFLRHNAPYQALSSKKSVAEKYLSTFNYEDCPERGFHIMRRTFTPRMLRSNIPKSVISASIGQISPNSVDHYLSVEEEKMRKCAISLSGIKCERGDLL